MHTVHIIVRVDEQADEPTVSTQVTVDDAVVYDAAGTPATWRSLTDAACALDETVATAVKTAEDTITAAVATREQKGAEVQRRRKAAARAWSAVTETPA